MRINGFTIGLTATLAILTSTSVLADSLPVALTGQGYFTLGGVTAASDSALDGTAIYDQLQSFSYNGYSGQVQVRVVQETVSGTLDFYWRIINDPNSAGAITAFRVSGFGDYSLAADYRPDGLGVAGPNQVYNEAISGTTPVPGDVNFYFNTTPVAPGTSSEFFFLQTQATSFAPNGIYDMLCGNSCYVFGPWTAQVPATVPLPASGWLLVPALAGLGVVGRRRRR